MQTGRSRTDLPLGAPTWHRGTVAEGRWTTADYGELQSVLLYRDVRGDRWKYAIYDSGGHYDGWLVGLSLEHSFPDAAAALAAFVQKHWKQALPGPWHEQQEGWWKAGSGPG